MWVAIELSDDVLFSVFHAVRRVAGAVRGVSARKDHSSR